MAAVSRGSGRPRVGVGAVGRVWGCRSRWGSRRFHASAGQRCRAETDTPDGSKAADPLPPPASKGGKGRVVPESTDAVASALTRRFGIAGGLLWFAFLAVGTLGEQLKTRLEVARESSTISDELGDPVRLPSGVVYQDVRVGGGAAPSKGNLVVVHLRGSYDDVLFEDTKERGKPLVALFGTRPFTGGLNPGLEEVLSTMTAGSIRKCTIPPAMGFGSEVYAAKATRHAQDKEGIVPPGSTLEYTVELLRVSIAP